MVSESSNALYSKKGQSGIGSYIGNIDNIGPRGNISTLSPLDGLTSVNSGQNTVSALVSTKRLRKKESLLKGHQLNVDDLTHNKSEITSGLVSPAEYMNTPQTHDLADEKF
jgi:hypothetical protein